MRRLGALRWAELAVFAVAGSWVVSTVEPPARIAMAATSRHAARRAATLGDRLPSTGPLEASVVTVPVSPALADLVEEVAALGDTAERLGALGVVMLDGIADALGDLVGVLSPVADATSLRTLPPLVADLRADADALRRCAGDLGLAPDPRWCGELAGRVVSAGGWVPATVDGDF